MVSIPSENVLPGFHAKRMILKDSRINPELRIAKFVEK